jgi:hypothetical protein
MEDSGMMYALADITISGNHSNFTGEHNVSGMLDTIDKGLTTAIVVVKLAPGDTVIDVDGRDLELTLMEGLVEVMDTGRGLFRCTLDIIEVLRELLVDHQGEVTTIVENHVEGLAIGEGS